MDLFTLDSGLFSDGFGLTKGHHRTWATETKRFKTVRGEIIVLCFELEYTIGLAISDLLLPVKSLRSPDWLHQRHVVFHSEVLEQFDLRRKMEILCSLLSSRFPRQGETIRELRSLFSQIRSLRNMMAHSPVVFKAVSRKSETLQPYLETSKGYIHITDKYLAMNKSNVLKAAKLLGSLMRKVGRSKRRSATVE